MTDTHKGDDAGLNELKPQFGDLIENGWASRDNPTRCGIFVREGVRQGRLNGGPYWEVTDGKGKFWELAPPGGPLGSKIAVTRRPTDDASPPVGGSTGIPADVARLVNVARDVARAHSNTVFGIPSLADALEAFAHRVPWEDEPAPSPTEGA